MKSYYPKANLVTRLMVGICLLAFQMMGHIYAISWVQPNNEYLGGPESYGAGEQIDATQFDAIGLRRGDEVFLEFPDIPLQIQSNPFFNFSTTGNVVRIHVLDTAQTGSMIPITFLFPNQTYTFTIRILLDVWPGDANADGRRNMYDLLAIVLGMRMNISPRNDSLALIYPPQTEQMNSFFDVDDWLDTQNQPLELLGGDRMINCKHADCNLDGRINRLDVEYLMAVLTPLAQNGVYNYLIGAPNGIELRARIVPTSLIPSIFQDPHDSNKPPMIGLNIQFEILVENAPPGTNDSIVGIVFSRPILETADLEVVTTFFSPEMHLNPKYLILQQRFWNKLRRFDTGNKCATAVEKPLDVGVCVRHGPLIAARNGEIVGTCTVTLLDVLRSVGGPPLAMEQFIVNGRMGIVSDNKSMVQNVQCVADITSVNMAAMCPRVQAAVLRDGLGDCATASVCTDSAAWISPDIWVRQQDDGGFISQNPIPGDSAFVNVRVFNFGCSSVENVKVKVYWGYANTAMTWPMDFSNGQGGLIGTMIIPSIDPWGSAIGQVKWGVPANIPVLDNGIPVFTLLAATVVTGDSIPLSSNLREAILSRKTVAARSSISLTDDHYQSIAASINLRNPNSNQGSVRLHLTQIGGPAEIALSKFGSFELFNFNGVVTPSQLQNMTLISSASEAVYRMSSDEIEGSIDFTINPAAISPNIGIRFIPHTQNQGGPIKYHYKLTMLVDGITYNSSIFEIEVAGT